MKVPSPTMIREQLAAPAGATSDADGGFERSMQAATAVRIPPSEERRPVAALTDATASVDGDGQESTGPVADLPTATSDVADTSGAAPVARSLPAGAVEAHAAAPGRQRAAADRSMARGALHAALTALENRATPAPHADGAPAAVDATPADDAAVAPVLAGDLTVTDDLSEIPGGVGEDATGELMDGDVGAPPVLQHVVDELAPVAGDATTAPTSDVEAPTVGDVEAPPVLDAEVADGDVDSDVDPSQHDAVAAAAATATPAPTPDTVEPSSPADLPHTEVYDVGEDAVAATRPDQSAARPAMPDAAAVEHQAAAAASGRGTPRDGAGGPALPEHASDTATLATSAPGAVAATVAAAGSRPASEDAAADGATGPRTPSAIDGRTAATPADDVAGTVIDLDGAGEDADRPAAAAIDRPAPAPQPVEAQPVGAAPAPTVSEARAAVADTPATLATRIAARVEAAVEALRNAPPPREATIDVDGLRVTLRLVGDTVHVGTDRVLPAGAGRELGQALAGRGLQLADGSTQQGGGRGQQGARDQQPAPAPRRFAEPALAGRAAGAHRAHEVLL